MDNTGSYELPVPDSSSGRITICRYSITVNASDFQSEDGVSITPTCSNSFAALV